MCSDTEIIAGSIICAVLQVKIESLIKKKNILVDRLHKYIWFNSTLQNATALSQCLATRTPLYNDPFKFDIRRRSRMQPTTAQCFAVGNTHTMFPCYIISIRPPPPSPAQYDWIIIIVSGCQQRLCGVSFELTTRGSVGNHKSRASIQRLDYALDGWRERVK